MSITIQLLGRPRITRGAGAALGREGDGAAAAVLADELAECR